MRGAVAASLVLVDDYDTLTVRPEVATGADPIVCRNWDLGAPEVRAASADLANADGTVDRAGYTGARTVTLDLIILGDADNSPYAYAERLAAMTHPSRRPILRVTRNTPEAAGQVWEMSLRGSPFSISYGRRAAAMLEMQLVFNAPLGYLQGQNQGYESNVSTVVGLSGMVIPVTFPADFGAGGDEVPSLTLKVGGSAPIHPTIYIFGPVTDPTVVTDDGESFGFTGLTVNTSQFVAIDMGNGTVRLNGEPDQSMYHLVNFSTSTFWRWQPGVHVARYFASSGRMAIHWRERRFTI